MTTLYGPIHLWHKKFLSGTNYTNIAENVTWYAWKIGGETKFCGNDFDSFENMIFG